MKNRIFKMFNLLINEIEFEKGLTFEHNRYFLNLQYDWASYLLHSLINNESYLLDDYFLGKKEGIDKYISFEDKNELAAYLCDLIISDFDCLRVNLEDDFFDLKKEWNNNGK